MNGNNLFMNPLSKIKERLANNANKEYDENLRIKKIQTAP